MPHLASGASSYIIVGSRTFRQRRDLNYWNVFLTVGKCSPFHSAVLSCHGHGLRRGGGQTSKEHSGLGALSLQRPFQYTLFSRSVSTNTPQAPKETHTHDEQPPPAAVCSTACKLKPKIELRPGPVKPGGCSSTSSLSTTRPVSKASVVVPPQQQSVFPQQQKTHPSTLPSLSTASKEEILHETENASLIEMAKRDVQDAAAHGILKPPPPDASWAGRLFHQAKELFKFYLAGLKFIIRNRKEANLILERVKSGGDPLTWREHRFITTNKADILKLGPFVLTLAIIEEIVPLIVIYAPGMLPSTCILPSQRARIHAKRHERQREAYMLAKDLDVFKETGTENLSLIDLTNYQVKMLCSSVGVSSTGPVSILRWRLSRRLSALSEEDTFLLAEGKGARLTQAEVEEILWERGFLADLYDPVRQREQLRWWVNKTNASDPVKSSASVDGRVRLLVQMHLQSQ